MAKPPKFTDELLDELDEFLMSNDAPDDCMQISDLDGFLTGIVVGPELIMPSEWVPIIWQGDEPNFEDEEQAEHIVGIIVARYNEIIHQLDEEPDAFAPIFLTAPGGVTIAADWAEGFMDAFGLRPDAWDPLLQDENEAYLMGPIMAFLHDKDGKPLVDGTTEEMATIMEESAGAIPHVIKEIYDFWKARRGIANDNSRAFGTKVGRNDPCPCGSGKKYKRCCGAN
ncbi:MAG: UPF0149 family protein [Proteobacteria bacterium]|nr:UPF0149 family protein [Pseudomonadota bacterium]